MHLTAKLGLIAAALSCSACSTLAPGFGERDRFVVNTPQYADNRVLFLSPTSKSRTYQLLTADQVTAASDAKSQIEHGSPLSIIVSGIYLPSDPLAKPDVTRSRDIALVLDVGTNVNGSSSSIVAWYQRGVLLDQTLNFANLLVYFDPKWDARVAPYFRIRLVDVTSERNQETREALGQIKQYTSSLGPLFGASSQAIVGVATSAASMILSHPNKQILDYSVQFYSREQIKESYGANLTPLVRGRFLLVGRPIGQSSAFWRNISASFDQDTYGVTSSGTDILSPVITMTVSTAQSIVPTIVVERSSYLQKLLNDAQKQDVDAIKAAGQSVMNGITTYVDIDKLRSNRDLESITQVYNDYTNSATNSLSDSDKSLLRYTLASLSACDLGTVAKVQLWWSKNSSSFQFAHDGFKLEKETC